LWALCGPNNNIAQTNYLISHGWGRSKSNYKKGNDLITYNGTEWFLNGKEITSINDIP